MPMRVLVLGGTVFLGRHVVDEALRRGHDVTLFNRGRSNPGLYTGRVEEVTGDRDGDLSALGGRGFDAVVDTSGYVPRLVADSARALSASGHYTFVSSLSVYASNSQPWADETAAVGTLDDPSVETVDGATYGPLKALCEQAAEEQMPGRVLSVRAGLIVGPHDPTDRFTYWPVRVARGGRVLAPGSPADPVQFIDGRDLASWMLDCAEGRVAGVFNATGPAEPATIGQLLDACLQETGSSAELVWADPDFLAQHKVAPWAEMTAWVPDTDEYAGFMRTSVEKALGAGLRTRPVRQTVADTLAWHSSRPDGYSLRAGLDPGKERETLEALAGRS